MVREPPRFFQFQFIIIIIIININLHNINKVPHAEDFRNKNRLLVVQDGFRWGRLTSITNNEFNSVKNLG